VSYQFHNHAGWVESNNRSLNRVWRDSRSKRKPPLLPEALTEFQAKAMDILGMTFGGIYNAPIRWERVDWMPSDRGIVVPLDSWGRDFSTWDFNKLTMFVFLCHEARVRGSLQADKFKPITLWLSPRSHEGGIATRHPNLDEAVADFRAYLPAEHRIIYRGGRVAMPVDSEAAA
jgi:hypothetical protein